MVRPLEAYPSNEADVIVLPAHPYPRRELVDAFQPIINLLVLLTALSVAAERITNMMKLRRDQLREDKGTGKPEQEYAVHGRTFVVGLVIALLFKADLFEILANLDAPWETLGWVKVEGGRFLQSTASQNLGSAVYAAVGSLFTGTALGFGSKFWHDVLGAVYELRDSTRRRKPPVAVKG